MVLTNWPSSLKLAVNWRESERGVGSCPFGVYPPVARAFLYSLKSPSEDGFSPQRTRKAKNQTRIKEEAWLSAVLFLYLFEACASKNALQSTLCGSHL